MTSPFWITLIPLLPLFAFLANGLFGRQLKRNGGWLAVGCMGGSALISIVIFLKALGAASVVMVQAFGEPAFPVDTHIHRLAARWGLSRARNVVETERDLKRLFAPEDWGKVHLQLIYFGREHCPARGHELDDCPICAWAASQERKARERGEPARRTRTA